MAMGAGNGKRKMGDDTRQGMRDQMDRIDLEVLVSWKQPRQRE